MHEVLWLCGAHHLRGFQSHSTRLLMTWGFSLITYPRPILRLYYGSRSLDDYGIAFQAFCFSVISSDMSIGSFVDLEPKQGKYTSSHYLIRYMYTRLTARTTCGGPSKHPCQPSTFSANYVTIVKYMYINTLQA